MDEPPEQFPAARLSVMSLVPLAICAAAALCVVAVALATHAHTLTETDSINLARGLQHYSVATQSPHPPGYPLVVLTAHLFAWTGSILNAVSGRVRTCCGRHRDHDVSPGPLAL